ncbi:MAG: helix-turn-helix transcriptional regulator [Bacteroidales bacterium]|nr:helix-turn-helix transcriptional regulator [Bacteroidales bacterium]
MYTLKDAWIIMHGKSPFEGWNGRVMCARTDAEISFRANRTQGFMAAYTFTLVREGSISIIYNGKHLTLGQNDLYIYSPGMSVTIVSATKNYQGICLLVDEGMTLESDTVRDMIRLAYLPVVRLHEPKIALSQSAATLIHHRLEEILHYLDSDNPRKAAVLEHLYAVFLLEVQNELEQSSEAGKAGKHKEDVFISFLSLLSESFAEHHDIPFYAGELNITTTYLSRVVRQMSGRTVIDYVNRLLLMEASFLLRTTNLSIREISDRLNFSEQAAFSKFFTRLQGESPKKYRQRKVL